MTQARHLSQKRMNNEEKRKQLRQDTLAAWTDYQATGLHVTGEESDAWLAKLETSKLAVIPECLD
jgi:predicted transcriptional regulator